MLGIGLGGGFQYQPQREYQQGYTAEQIAVDGSRTPGHPVPYDTLCGAPQSHDDADLCEQWRSAEKTSESAFYARAQFWLGLVGFLAISVTIALAFRANDISHRVARDNVKATRAAIRANTIARESAQRQLRPYVHPLTVQCEPMYDEDAEHPYWWYFVQHWKNSGATPTKKLRLWIQPYLSQADLPADFPFDGDGQHIPMVIPPGDSMQSARVTIPGAEIIAIRDGHIFFYIWGWAKYEDGFPGTPLRVTKFCYRMIPIAGNPAAPVNEQNRVVWRSEVYHRHNGTDDEGL